MLEEPIEERLEALTKKVEELSTEVETLKKEREEDADLIPEAEYDFVPTVKDKVIAEGIAKIIRFTKASSGLGLSQREWEQFSTGEHAK